MEHRSLDELYDWTVCEIVSHIFQRTFGFFGRGEITGDDDDDDEVEEYAVFRNPEQRTKIVKVAEYCSPVPEVCGICLEYHQKKQCVILGDCGHNFGTSCFQEWTETCKRENQILTCPICRREVKLLTRFRRRKKPHYL
jgi:Ring finger domain